MTTRIDADDIQPTRGERLLAVTLAVFLLVGVLWAYAELDSGQPDVRQAAPLTQLSSSDRALLRRHDSAVSQADTADRRVSRAHAALVDRREAYRTALDAGQHDARLQRAYQAAQAGDAAARTAARRLHASERAARRAIEPVQTRLDAIEHDQERHAQDVIRRHDLIVAGLRLLLVLGAAGGALWLFVTLRRRRSRWLIAGYSSVGAAAVLALVMGIDYITDVFNPIALGPLVLSVVGTLLTLAAIAALQRYVARRIPGRRVRRAECPFCGYPTRGEHCEGCGRAVFAPCARCTKPRRVGAQHCAVCGEG